MQRLIIILLACSSLAAGAQTGYFGVVEASATSAAKNQQITISFKLRYRGNNPQQGRYGFVWPDNIQEMFEIVNHAQIHGFSRINDQYDLFHYQAVVRPRKTGTFTLNSGTIKFDGKEYSTPPIKFNIGAEVKPSAAVFVAANISRNSFYKGEEAVVTYTLYSKHNLRQLKSVGDPQLAGFTRTSLKPKQKLQQTNLNGERYHSLELISMKIYATRSGEFNIEPIEVEVVADIPTGRYVNTFFGREKEVRPQEVSVMSGGLKINVKALPVPAPDGFYGAVGKYELQSEIGATDVETGNAVTYRVKISGTGNMGFIREPDLALPPDFEVLEPTIAERGASKTYEYVLIPQQPGRFEVPAYTLSYFDPAAGQYKQASTSAYTVQVKRSADYDQGGGGRFVRDQDLVEELDKDIRHIRTTVPAFHLGQRAFFGTAAYYLLWGLPFVLLLPLGWYYTYRRRREADVVGRQKRNAGRQASRSLAQARKVMGDTAHEPFYKELNAALRSYLRGRFGLAMTDLGEVALPTSLARHNVPDDLIQGVVRQIRSCELALYAPGAAEATARQDALDACADLIDRFEKTTA